MGWLKVSKGKICKGKGNTKMCIITFDRPENVNKAAVQLNATVLSQLKLVLDGFFPLNSYKNI